MSPDALAEAWRLLQSHDGLEAVGPDPVAMAAAALDADFRGAAASLGALEWAGHDAWDDDDDLPLVREGAPGRVERPASLADLRRLVIEAEASGRRLRGRGASHSFSGLQTGEITLDTLGLKGRLSLDDHPFLPGVDREGLVCVLGGTRLRALNRWLVGQDRALANMGNYDKQSVAGAVSTDTHGTGLQVGPLSALVASIHLVTAGGAEVRIEPASARITDPARWQAAHPHVELVQSDARFDAAVVGLGCFGVVYSLVLRTRPVYWLRERRVIREWAEVAADLRSGVLPGDARVSVAINPYTVDGSRRCLVTTRTVEEVEPDDLSHDERHRTFWAAVASPSNVLARPLITAQLKPRNRRGQTIHTSLPRLRDDTYVARWDKVLVTGNPPVKAESAEIGVPLADAADAVEAVLDRLDPAHNGGSFWPTSPINLRFVAASRGAVSPMSGRATCMIEVPFLEFQWEDPAEKTAAALADVERLLVSRFGGRPHWAKHWSLEGVDLHALYPRLNEWLAQHKQVDPTWTFGHARFDALGWTSEANLESVAPDRIGALEERLHDERWTEADLEAAFALYEAAEEDLVNVIAAPRLEERPEDPRMPALRAALAAAPPDELVRRAWRLGAARPDLLAPAALRGLIEREAEAGREIAFDPAPPPGAWCNYVGEHAVVPVQSLRPESIGALVQALESLPSGRRVRVAGAGHSDSPVAAPDGTGLLLDLTGLTDISLDGTAQSGLTPQWARPGAATGLVRVSAGMRVAAINDALDAANLGLVNMGAYDRQAIFGAITTGTHGSGAGLGPLADSVRSLDVLTLRDAGHGTAVARLRIERGDGPTDPAAFASGPGQHGWTLVQDDDLFKALVVSFGHMGVVVAVTLAVRQRYWLREERFVSRLGQEMKTLRGSLASFRHYELLLNPYAGPEGDPMVVVTRRWIDPTPAGPTPSRKQPPTLVQLREAGPSKAAKCVLAGTVDGQRNRLALAMRASAGQQVDLSVSHEVLRLGAGDFVSARSCEVFFPLERLAPVLNRIAALAKEAAAKGILHTSPIGVRFVRGTDAWLAPSRGEGVMVAVEVPMLLTSPGADEVLDRLTTVLAEEFDARPHWGQHHRLDRAAVRRLYGADSLGHWVAALERLDPDGRLDSRYTDALGIRAPVA